MSKSILGLTVAMFLAFGMRATQPIFNISSLAGVTTGQIIDIDFHVDHFAGIISAQYSVNWNPNVLKYRTIKNFNANVPGLSPAVFGTTQALVDAGKFTLSWIEPGANQVTIADGSLFYTVEFEVVGSTCQSSSVAITEDPLEIEVSETGKNDVGLVTNNGNVTIQGEGCAQDIIINGNNLVGSCGTTTCVTFTVQNFNLVGAMDFTVLYDPSVLQFDHFQNYAPLLAFGDGNTNLIAPGTLRVVWINNNAVNENLADGTILFEVCFDVTGAGGTSSQISFGPGNDPDGSFFNIDTGLPHNATINPARITSQCTLQGFALVAEDSVCTTPNGIVCMDIAVNDFDDIVEMQFSMNWDSTKFIFDHVEGFNLAGLDINAFGTPQNGAGVKEGQLLVSWLDLTLNGVTVPDLTPIFRLCLKAIGPVGSSSPVIFSNDPLEIEIATLDSVLQFGLVQGIARIKTTCDTGTTCKIGYTINTTPPACPREPTGAVDLTVTLTNCTGTPTYLWSNTATTEDLTGVPAGTYTVTITLGSSIVIASTTVTDPPPLGVTGTITDPNPPGTCTGGINITVSGGMAPYSFLWSNGATTEDLSNICTGTYTVTITDAKGCTFIPDPYIVGADVTATVNNPTCAGICNGSVSNLTPSFGNAPYTYLWSNGATTKDINNLCAGTYCVTITDIGGSTRDTCFNITQPPALVVTATLINDVNENCHGAIDLNVTGGTPAYSYAWSNLATTQDILNLCPGQYCVTITHNLGACSFDTCFNIFAGDFRIDPTVKQYGSFQTSCNGVCDGDINAVVTGGTTPITYHWSNGSADPHITGLCAGVYTLTVTDASGKTAVSTTTITSPPALDLNITSTLPTDITASDGAISVVVTGGVPNYIYQWTGPVSWNTAAQNNLPSGIYHLLVTDANQCRANEDVELIPEGPGCYEGIPIITPNDDGKNDYFIITCAIGTNNHLSIYNRSGGLVYETNNYTNNWTGVDGDHQTLPDGGYFWILEIFSPTVPTQVVKGTVNILRTAD